MIMLVDENEDEKDKSSRVRDDGGREASVLDEVLDQAYSS